MDKIIDLIPLRNTLARDVKYNKLKNVIMVQLNNFADNKYKSNPEVILHIITLIENLIEKKDRIDKLQLAVDVFCELYQTQDVNEIKTFSIIVEFLIENKQVKKISSLKYVSKFIKGFF